MATRQQRKKRGWVKKATPISASAKRGKKLASDRSKREDNSR